MASHWRVTNVLVGLIVLTYLVAEWLGGSSNGLVLIRMGALVPALVWDGEPWRIVTAMLLHGGFWHLFFNGFTLWQIGPLVEHLYGRGSLLLLFVLCGIGGGIASASGQSPHTLVVGASGAIFGLAGCLITTAMLHPDWLPPHVRRVLVQAMVPFVGYNLLFGLLMHGIDNFGHIGGLLTGGALGVILRPGRRLHWSQWIWGLAASAVLCAALVAQWQVQWKYSPEQMAREAAGAAAPKGNPI